MMNLLSPDQLRPNLVLPVLSGDNEKRWLETGGINLYRTVSEFYQDAMFGQLPRVDADAELLEAFERSTLQRSINGYGAIIRSGTNHIVPSTRYAWRWEEDGLHRGWIVGWPYKSNSRALSPADRIRIFISENDRDLLAVQDWVLEGGSLGSRIGDDMNPEGAIAVWGNGVSDYPPIVDLLAWYNDRIKANNDTLDRVGNPHLQGPVEARDEQGRVELTPEGSFLGRTKDSAEFGYLVLDAEQPLNKETIGNLLDALHLVTGVPATAFGITSSTGDSGVSRERQMFKAISRVRRWRRDVETALRVFGVGDVAWIDDPFIGWTNQVSSELSLLAAGVISPDEVRERLNIGGTAPVREQRQNNQGEPEA